MSDLQRYEERRDYVISEVEYLLGTDTTTSIARRLGYKNAGGLARSLHRWGRRDLAGLVEYSKSVAA